MFLGFLLHGALNERTEIPNVIHWNLCASGSTSEHMHASTNADRWMCRRYISLNTACTKIYCVGREHQLAFNSLNLGLGHVFCSSHRLICSLCLDDFNYSAIKLSYAAYALSEIPIWYSGCLSMWKWVLGCLGVYMEITHDHAVFKSDCSSACQISDPVMYKWLLYKAGALYL